MTELRSLLRRIQSIILVAAGLVIFAGIALNAAQAAPQSTRVVVTPASVDIGSADTNTVTIRVEEVTKLYGLELAVQYDPTIVKVESIKPGDFLSADFVVEQKVDNDAGRASLAYTQIGHSPRSGSGAVALFTLRKTGCLGQSPLQLSSVILSDNNGNAIPHTLSPGQAQNGVPPANRKLTGSIFYDVNGDGTKGTGEDMLRLWPVYLQRFNLEPAGAQHLALSDQNGVFQIESLSCGRYQLWSQNGSDFVLTQTVDIPASSDVQVPALPITGTLRYPLEQVFLPLLVSQ